MSVVLIVDDISDYCEELAYSLSRDGHSVSYATNAADAIEIGTQLRPDILVTDWMLEEHIHGLNVSDTLRVVRPNFKTILMTGYASSDLHVDAKMASVSAFLEKPFPISGMRKAVKDAAAEPAPPQAANLDIGFIEIDAHGAITFVNAAAEKMFSDAKLSCRPPTLFELFEKNTLSTHGGGITEWVELSPLGAPDIKWTVHGRVFSGGERASFVILQQHNAPYLINSPLVCRLLGKPDPVPYEFDFGGHILSVDDWSSLRCLMSEVLRQAGAVCHTAANHREAMHLFAHDAKIQHIILDYDMPDGTPAELISRMRAIRPHVHIIGSSGSDHRKEFADLGVTDFLPKPWRMEDLLGVLAPKHDA